MKTTTVLEDLTRLSETSAQRYQRMQWFRDAKFGMFIHWGPCSVAEREIGWGREANRPWDINRHGPRTDDPDYDRLYQSFDPVHYDPDAWARFAKASGMRYMVLVTKHHDGFAMFDTRLSDYSIMHSPHGRDIVGPFVEACHRNDLKVGLYYSTRDWFHPDYLAGDNQAYDEWYRGQVEELLTRYGRIDMMWFDHVGGQDWGKWRFDELFSMMVRHQPHLLVNDRAAKFCGPSHPEDQEPLEEVRRMTQGDFYTPEGRIGAMDLQQDWESCIHVGQGWSYRGEDGFKGPDETIRMLVSCTTGGGNLLLNFGPRPDGTFADGEAAVARATGEWLRRYGDAVYGTRGGPYRNGSWGGSCHKGTSLYLHVFQWPASGLRFDPLPRRVRRARTLDGHPVGVRQDGESLWVEVESGNRVEPVTVVELVMDHALEAGTLLGGLLDGTGDQEGAGEIVFEQEGVRHDDPASPGVILDMNRPRELTRIEVGNPKASHGTGRLDIFLSLDGGNWTRVLRGEAGEAEWCVEPTHFHAGIDVPGCSARYVRLEPLDADPGPVVFPRVRIFALPSPS